MLPGVVAAFRVECVLLVPGAQALGDDELVAFAFQLCKKLAHSVGKSRMHEIKFVGRGHCVIHKEEFRSLIGDIAVRRYTLDSMATQFLESSKYSVAGMRDGHSYLFPCLMKLCSGLPAKSRVLDVGCGSGSVSSEFAKRGHSVVGIDLAEPGIRIAGESCPSGKFALLPADKDVLTNLGEAPFDLVYSLEVIEHLYDPRSFLAGCFAATKSGSVFICSTPYHGYLKNLSVCLFNGWDRHMNPLFDGGHIKFFSRKTLTILLQEAGFRNLRFRGAGRLPYLWKSMFVSGTKP